MFMLKLILFLVDKRIAGSNSSCFLKGSVSRILRWVLLHINQKLSLRPIASQNFKFIHDETISLYKGAHNCFL